LLGVAHRRDQQQHKSGNAKQPRHRDLHAHPPHPPAGRCRHIDNDRPLSSFFSHQTSRQSGTQALLRNFLELVILL
jgi:hypothetical protein